MYRRGAWDSAFAHYSRPVEEDADFALAWYRLSDAVGQLENVASEQAAEYARQAAALADELPEGARLRVRANAMFNEGRAEAVYLLEELTRKYPADFEAWYDLGEAYYPYGTVARRRREQVGEALRRVLELDPGFYAAYQHLIEYEMLAGNRGEAGRLIEASRPLTNDSGPPAFDLVHTMVFGDSSARAGARGDRCPGTAPCRPGGPASAATRP